MSISSPTDEKQKQTPPFRINIPTRAVEFSVGFQGNNYFLLCGAHRMKGLVRGVGGRRSSRSDGVIQMCARCGKNRSRRHIFCSSKIRAAPLLVHPNLSFFIFNLTSSPHNLPPVTLSAVISIPRVLFCLTTLTAVISGPLSGCFRPQEVLHCLFTQQDMKRNPVWSHLNKMQDVLS